MSVEIIGTDRKGNEWGIQPNLNNEWDILKNGVKETEMSTRANALVLINFTIGYTKAVKS
jgi:hypothetical protein